MPPKAHDPFNTAKPHTKGVRRSPIHIEDLEVADDPPPQKRSLGPGRYDELFASMKPGQFVPNWKDMVIPETTPSAKQSAKIFVQKK